MIVPVPVIAFPIALVAMLVVTGGVSTWTYYHGKFVAGAEQTEANLIQARKDFKVTLDLAKKANDAGQKFEEQKPLITERILERTKTIVIPADADPFVPVWFVRMFDRLASGDASADTYSGEPAGAPSRTRLSGTKPVLEKWVAKYEACQLQVDSIRELNPMLPLPKAEPGFFDKVNPF